MSRDKIFAEVDTTVTDADVDAVVSALSSVPEGFKPHNKAKRVMDNRSKMAKDKVYDWATAELLAFGTLAKDGSGVRLSGQDCKRGTFTSRHAVFFDVDNGSEHETLNNVSGQKKEVQIVNSPLSEQGCLGFEYGYSVADPDSLVLWEAQFGDFSNGAQIIIDNFLAGSEKKWKQTSGIVMLLPHGYEGQGPEHSNARPERYLQLCGNLNMQVANVTTPAQYFHMLRRQLKRDFRKPLIVMTPKSLLRDAEVISPLKEFTSGGFQEVLDDSTVKTKKDVDRLIFCTGKIYYEARRRAEES